LSENIPKSEEFSRKVAMLFPLLPTQTPFDRRCPLKTSLRNQQKLLGKWQESDFDDQTHWANLLAKNGTGEVIRKTMLQENNYEGGH
jgi:hypothetical protein